MRFSLVVLFPDLHGSQFNSLIIHMRELQSGEFDEKCLKINMLRFDDVPLCFLHDASLSRFRSMKVCGR